MANLSQIKRPEDLPSMTPSQIAVELEGWAYIFNSGIGNPERLNKEYREKMGTILLFLSALNQQAGSSGKNTYPVTLLDEVIGTLIFVRGALADAYNKGKTPQVIVGKKIPKLARDLMKLGEQYKKMEK